MFTKIFQKLTTTTGGGAVIIALFGIASRVLGLVRDRLLASHFGAGDILDAYFAAFKIPDLIFNTLVLGAFSAAFIPVFVGLWQKEADHRQAWQVSVNLMNILTLILIIIGVICLIFVKQIVPLIAPGFLEEKLALTIKLTRIMMISMIFFGVSNVLSGILNSLKRFVSFSLAPLMYNLGIIFGIAVLVKFFGPFGLGWGVVLGSFLHMMIQVPMVRKVGFRWRPELNYHLAEVRKIGLLMLPRSLALGIHHFNQVITTIIASLLASGSLAVYNFAFNLQSFPVGVFAISIALAAFPAFSESFSTGDNEGYMVHFSVATRRVLYLIVPLSAFFILLRAQIVRVTLGAGAFDWTDTVLTANSLGFFCLSLFAQGLQPIFTRAFYARQDTKTPLFISLVTLFLNIFLAIWLSAKMGVSGLALAFSLASIINILLLFIILRQMAGYLDDKQILKSILKISVATLMASLLLQLSKPFFASLVNMQTFLGVLLQGLGAGSVGIIVYLILTFIWHSPEIEVVKKIFIRK